MEIPRKMLLRSPKTYKTCGGKSPSYREVFLRGDTKGRPLSKIIEDLFRLKRGIVNGFCTFPHILLPVKYFLINFITWNLFWSLEHGECDDKQTWRYQTLLWQQYKHPRCVYISETSCTYTLFQSILKFLLRPELWTSFTIHHGK